MTSFIWTPKKKKNRLAWRGIPYRFVIARAGDGRARGKAAVFLLGVKK